MRAAGTLVKEPGSALTYTLTASINSSRADRFPDTSGETANFEAALKYVRADWVYGLSYNPTMDYSQWFDDYSGTSHVIAGTARTTITLSDGIKMTPVFGVARREHTNPLAERTRGSLKAVFEKDIFSKKATLSLIPSIAFDAYDRSPVPSQRHDVSYGVTLGIEVPVNEQMSWSLSVAYQERHSSVDGLDYNVMQVLPGLSANYQF